MLPTNTDLVAEQWFYYFLYINECWHLIIGGSIELENMWIPERFVHEDIVGIIHLTFWSVLLISARGCVVRISYKLRKWCRLNMHHIILLLRVTIIQLWSWSCSTTREYLSVGNYTFSASSYNILNIFYSNPSRHHCRQNSLHIYYIHPITEL